MKIPKEIRINGIDYKIEKVEHLDNGMYLCYGHISFDNCVIRLNLTNQSHQKLCVTLWHEILHGIIDSARLDFKKAKEEYILDVLARGIYQILQDNGRDLFDIERGESCVTGQAEERAC